MDSSVPIFPVSHFAAWLQDQGVDAAGLQTLMFGDSPELAAELLELVAGGEKTATAGLLWRWLADEGAPPLAGQRYVVHDWSGAPVGLIENAEVRVIPFVEVDLDFARAEGEGFETLAQWREAHWAYFSRECERLGHEVSEAMPVVCQRFRRLLPR